MIQGKGKEIAEWFWKPGTTARHEHLDEFAIACAPKRQEASAWCKLLYTDVTNLLNPKCPIIKKSHHFNGKEHWENAAANFLLFFYTEYLGHSSSDESKQGKFPTSLFTQNDKESPNGYGRVEFLKYFSNDNDSLEMCPCCDENRLYSRKEAIMRTNIDHFLPKSLYPHLACHPYNLVPTCHVCNETFKGEKDPFRDCETLSRDFFPYGQTKLRSIARLKISNEDETDPTILHQRLELVAHKNFPGVDNTSLSEEQLVSYREGTKAVIGLARTLYGIPDRWHPVPKMALPDVDEMTDEQREQMLKVLLMGETLLRRICQFLGQNERFHSGVALTERPPTTLKGTNAAAVVYNDLKLLLYYLSTENQGKDPLAFALTWILAAKLKDDIYPATQGKESRLLDEIVAWYHGNATTLAQREQVINDLFQKLEE